MKKTSKKAITENTFTEFLLYTDPNGKVKVEIFLRDENIWLTQAKIAELFGVERSVVTKHLQNIFETGELNKEATCAKIAQVQNEGNRQVKRVVKFYNLIKKSKIKMENDSAKFKNEFKSIHSRIKL